MLLVILGPDKNLYFNSHASAVKSPNCVPPNEGFWRVYWYSLAVTKIIVIDNKSNNYCMRIN